MFSMASSQQPGHQVQQLQLSPCCVMALSDIVILHVGAPVHQRRVIVGILVDVRMANDHPLGWNAMLAQNVQYLKGDPRFGQMGGNGQPGALLCLGHRPQAPFLLGRQVVVVIVYADLADDARPVHPHRSRRGVGPPSRLPRPPSSPARNDRPERPGW